jgi:hypothetical protein
MKLYRVSSCISFNYTTGGSCTEFSPVSVLIMQLEEVVQSFKLMQEKTLYNFLQLYN